ncbi:MAG: aminopeptidase P family N-terminal domain-containing protein [Arhodomonas sp.]|nr:aminopeptidase P family N-terminal domain-containing protein [Arhodomonas sp.]
MDDFTHPHVELPDTGRPITPSAPVGNYDSVPMSFDPKALRAGRLRRLRAMMAEQGYAAVVLFDPYNQRYATGSRNMFGYFLRNSTRYIYVPQEGPVILFEYPGSAHVSTWLETIDEIAHFQGRVVSGEPAR